MWHQTMFQVCRQILRKEPIVETIMAQSKVLRARSNNGPSMAPYKVASLVPIKNCIFLTQMGCQLGCQVWRLI